MKIYRECKVWILPVLAVWIGMCGCGEKTGLVIQDAGNVSETEEPETKESGAGTGDSGINKAGTDAEDSGTGTKASGTKESGKAGTGKDTLGIYVQVSGAVKHPGVYELESGSRVFQAVEQAGGVTDEAEERYINQAEVLTDGQMIYVMTKEEAKEQEQTGSTGEEPQAQGDSRVNLNTASQEELQTLPGIGAAKAKSIMAWREANGGFSAIEDLMQIEGIKEGVFSKIKDSIKVN